MTVNRSCASAPEPSSWSPDAREASNAYAQDRCHRRPLGHSAEAERSCSLLRTGRVGNTRLGDFIGEFLILMGTYHTHVAMATVAACGVLAATFYILRFVQRVFQGPNLHPWQLPDLTFREGLVLGAHDRFAALAWLISPTRLSDLRSSSEARSRTLEMIHDRR